MPVQLFVAMLGNPAVTGSLLPSSSHLANCMATAAIGSDLVIELGAGTGPMTRALLRLAPHTPLIAVEIQPRLAQILKKRHPSVDVRLAPAKEVLDALGDAPGNITVLSSLPFRSLPRDVAAETIESVCRFLSASPTRKLVQFTYQPRAPFDALPSLRWKRTAIIWKNPPPAGVWELRADVGHHDQSIEATSLSEAL